MAGGDFDSVLDIMRKRERRGREVSTPQPNLGGPNLLKQWLLSMVNAGQFPEAGPWGGFGKIVDPTARRGGEYLK